MTVLRCCDFLGPRKCRNSTNLKWRDASLSTGAGGSHTIVGSHNATYDAVPQYLAMTLGGNTAGTPTTFHATTMRLYLLTAGAK